MLRHRLVPPVLAVLALTACSSADGTAAPQAVQQDGAAAEVVSKAASATATSGTSKFALTSTTSIGSQDVTFSGEGAFDYDGGAGQLTFEVPGADGSPSGGGTIEERIIGPDLFLTIPQMPGTFYKLKVADVAGTSIGGSTDPTSSLKALQGLEGVKEVGTEQLRGVQATHYEGTYDVQAAIDAATGGAKAVLEQTLGASTLERVPFDAFVDGEGRIVKLEQELALPGSAQTGGQAVTSRTVLELFDFGAEVTVAAPPATAVKDGAPLLAALRAAVPEGEGDQAPAPSAAPGVPSPGTPPAASPSPAAPAPPTAAPSASPVAR